MIENKREKYEEKQEEKENSEKSQPKVPELISFPHKVPKQGKIKVNFD